MRPKVVLIIMLLALAVAALICWHVKSSSHSLTAPVTQADATTVTAPENIPSSNQPSRTVTTASVAVADTNMPAVSADQPGTPAEDPQQRVTELMALAMNDDSTSLNIIWSELSNPNKEIRAGALAAVVQFGDRSLAPRLRDLAAQTTDAQEKVNILAAADQLALPPLGTLRASTDETSAPQ